MALEKSLHVTARIIGRREKSLIMAPKEYGTFMSSGDSPSY